MKETRFYERVLEAAHQPLTALDITTLQVNIGYCCNLTCKHCHIAAGPSRTEMMDRHTIDAVIRALQESRISVLDITGGAPELNPHFRYLVREARKIGSRVICRTNLAVFYEPGMEDLPEFYLDHQVELVASLPYYREEHVDRVRGSGTFKKCIAALQKLNARGYGDANETILDLVYNPPGAFFAPDQKALEAEYKKALESDFDISFNRLYTFTNMPIGRFRDFLVRTGNFEKYSEKLICAFNPQTLDNIMCRRMLSVGWDGRLYDCDFNQVLGLAVNPDVPSTITDFDATILAKRTITVGEHCFGCTAGQGST